jgi:lysine-specific demethylase 8
MTQLERVRIESAEQFERDYIAQGKAVVITNLFEGERIRELRSREDVLAAWGDQPIPLGDHYDEAIGIDQLREQLGRRMAAAGGPRRAASPEGARLPESLPFVEYCRRVAEDPHSLLARVSFACPRFLLDSFSIPEVCRSRNTETPELQSMCFVGNRASFSQAHFDKDGFHGFLYQLYGEKRFIVFPREASQKLAPLTQFSAWCIQSFNDGDREAFLKFTGGQETLLRAGDCVYFPPFYWHFADYLSDCWGINLRCRRPQLVARLVRTLFPDLYLQGIGTRVAREPHLPASIAAVEQLEQALAATEADAEQRSRTLLALARQLYADFYPGEPTGRYTLDTERYFQPLPHHPLRRHGAAA